MKNTRTTSLLAAQMERAKILLLRGRAKGAQAATIHAIVASLRLSLAATLGGLDLGRPLPGRFVLRVGAGREHAVTLEDRPLTIPPAALERLFASAGLRLEAGQLLLLDPAVVRQALDEEPSQPPGAERGTQEQPPATSSPECGDCPRAA